LTARTCLSSFAISVAFALATSGAYAAIRLPPVDARHMVVHVRVYDPPSLVEQNNDVIKTDTGSSQFRDFTFDKPAAPPLPAAR